MGSGEFDFIIVGAGSSGCVLADRLTRNGRKKVLVIESGPIDWNPLISVPRGFGRTMLDQKITWTYPAVKTGGYNEPEYWLRGKVLGGSSSLNGMVYMRGIPSDYDAWEAQGCKGWGWADISAAFEAIEDHELGPGGDRGVGGPLKVTVHPDGHPMCRIMLAAAGQAGLPQLEDLNATGEVGIGYQPRTISKGRRQSAAVAFLKPAMKRPNLTVMTRTDVVGLVLEGKRAVGVRIRKGDGEQVLRANEVILSAGAIATPRILQLAGIGPADRLRSIGITPVHDSPDVGENLREHRTFIPHYRVKRFSDNRDFHGVRLGGQILNYLLFRKGPLASAAFELSAFVRTEPGEGRPDAQLSMSPYSYDHQREGINLEREPGATCMGYAMRPESKGWLRVQSADPNVHPEINPNYLATDYDRRVSVGLFRFTRCLFEQPALAAIVEKEVRPGVDVQTDDEIIDVFHRLGNSSYHAAGTCRMGADDRSVVDPNLRVRGMEGLRVVDISVMPSLVSTNTNGPAMAMAWRAADLIEADH